MLRPVRRRRILINALAMTAGGRRHSYLVNLLRELDLDSRGFDFTVPTHSEKRGGTESGWIDFARVYFTRDDAVGLARAAERVRRERDAAKDRIAWGRARAAEFTRNRSMDRLCRVFDEVLAEGRRGA